MVQQGRAIFDAQTENNGLLLKTPNWPVCFEGEFERIGIANGRGILQMTLYDCIEGQMHGNILSSELKITNATYKRFNVNDRLNQNGIFEYYDQTIE